MSRHLEDGFEEYVRTVFNDQGRNMGDGMRRELRRAWYAGALTFHNAILKAPEDDPGTEQAFAEALFGELEQFAERVARGET